ncbi:hypothetical protein HLH36_17335 [Gluconacetobacter aggeris]|uniref:Hint domain-containing protein n=1 Tax=Gluconacetobacter aggeris TaxID=1286186 RepID=A0A7W4NZY7_9PROT|nr:hypothetical protein [Gluconacetobacter aggeris]
MSDLFTNGGTNTTTRTYTSSGTTIVNPSPSNTLTNTSTGVLSFTPPAANIVDIYGNLTNSGSVYYKPSTVGTGNSFYLGSNSSNTLTQTGGTITYNQTNGTSGSSVYLQYGTITNDATSTIDLQAAAASTISAPYVSNLTNAGTIKVIDTSGTGMTSNWGVGTGTFNNTGSFSIDDSAGTSGSTTNLSFKTINNSGTVSFNVPGASTAITTVGSGGFTNSGTWSITSHGLGAGNIQIIGGTAAYTNTGTINVSDANLIVANALTGTGGIVNLGNNANVTLNGSNTGSGQTFNFSGADNTLNILNGASFTGVLRGFSQGDTLQLHVPGTPTYNTNTGILTITSGTHVYTYDVGKGYTGTFSDTLGTVTYSGATPCYLAGSMLRTPHGDRAVETLDIGDQLIAQDADTGAEIIREIIWVGKKAISVNPHRPDDESGYPVRVLKDAIAEGVPYKDMLITAEHCLFFDGHFVPARMLVNGRSIFYDRSMNHFEIYHVETEIHSILIADGVLSESFLNTENHRSFHRSSPVVPMKAAPSLTWDDAAAPLGISRAFAEPLFRQIESHAIQAGHPVQDDAPALSEDPDLHLVTRNGTIIRQARTYGDRVVFMIPAHIDSVWIMSNTSRPSDVIGPFVDDRRHMGVAIGEITMFEANHAHTLTAHMTEETLDGWHGLQADGLRWTAGHALLPLGDRQPDSVALLSIQIRAAGPYLLENTIRSKATLLA